MSALHSETSKRRARNLRHLIDERYDGKIKDFAQDVGLHPSYVSNMLASLRGTANSRPVTEKMAGRIEEALGLAVGELSRPNDDDDSVPVDSRVTEAMEGLLAAISAQRQGSEADQRTIGALRDSVAALWGTIGLLCECISEGSPRQRAVFTQAFREAALRGGASGSNALRMELGALSERLAEKPTSLEEAAARTAEQVSSIRRTA